VEWVETVAKSVAEAKDLALDRLGVDEQDAEFEVLAEPQPGLFGRMRGEARVRARVRPTQPRPKAERRDRGRKPRRDDAAGDATTESRPPRERAERAPRPERAAKESSPRGEGMPDVTLEDQTASMHAFLTGLLDAFGLEASVAVTPIDEETAELAVTGSELGLLIGPKGQTLQAIQELARAAAMQALPGRHVGRVRIDVSGYRQRRKEALERFTREVAQAVIDSGTRKVLEPMSAPDRKVVHDAVNDIDGVTTSSEGEEPRRRVIISPVD
jgi:spoIIIJ-associated protein